MRKAIHSSLIVINYTHFLILHVNGKTKGNSEREDNTLTKSLQSVCYQYESNILFK